MGWQLLGWVGISDCNWPPVKSLAQKMELHQIYLGTYLDSKVKHKSFTKILLRWHIDSWFGWVFITVKVSQIHKHRNWCKANHPFFTTKYTSFWELIFHKIEAGNFFFFNISKINISNFSNIFFLFISGNRALRNISFLTLANSMKSCDYLSSNFVIFKWTKAWKVCF